MDRNKICSNKNIDKLTNKLNELINKNILLIKTIEPSNEILEILETIENRISCKDKIREYYRVNRIYGFYKSINKIENHLVELEKGDKEEQKKED